MIIGKRVKIEQKEKEGVLVALGISSEELRGGIGHYTTAVVMMDDGDIVEYPVQWIKVISKTTT